MGARCSTVGERDDGVDRALAIGSLRLRLAGRTLARGAIPAHRRLRRPRRRRRLLGRHLRRTRLALLFRLGTVLIGFGGGLFAVGRSPPRVARRNGEADWRSAPGAPCRRPPRPRHRHRRGASHSPRGSRPTARSASADEPQPVTASSTIWKFFCSLPRSRWSVRWPLRCDRRSGPAVRSRRAARLSHRGVRK